jgi:hypothetical protein
MSRTNDILRTPPSSRIRPEIPQVGELFQQLENFGPQQPSDIPLPAFDKFSFGQIPKKELAAYQKDFAGLGLYPKNKIDGKPGELTGFAASVAYNEDVARAELSRTFLRGGNLDETQIMKIQASLNRLGYEPGDIDGKIGPKTAKAALQYLQDYPAQADFANGDFKNRLGKIAGPDLSKQFDTAAGENLFINVRPKQEFGSSWKAETVTLFRPDMLEFLDRNPGRRKYFDLCIEKAEKYGLDPAMFANQIFQESGQSFDPNAKGPNTKIGKCLGIAQLSVSLAKAYGLSYKEIFDPEKALDVAAKHMRNLTDRYGSQEVAKIAYNGGGAEKGGAIEYLQRKTGKEQITVDDAIGQWNRDIATKGKGNWTTWRKQTKGYVEEAVTRFWPEKKIKEAMDRPENKALLERKAAPEKGPDNRPNTPKGDFFQLERKSAGLETNQPMASAAATRDIGRFAKSELDFSRTEPVNQPLGMEGAKGMSRLALNAAAEAQEDTPNTRDPRGPAPFAPSPSFA